MITELNESSTGLYKVTTEHGTYYEIDLDEMKARRVPAPERNELRADGEWFWIRGMDNIEVGKPINFRRVIGIAAGDWYTWRRTTNVISIEVLGEDK